MSSVVLPAEVGGIWFAVPAENVAEVLGAREWVAIPDATAELPGVLHWRGQAVAVLDLGVSCGGWEPLSIGMLRRRNIILRVSDCAVAVPVDSVREVIAVTELRQGQGAQIRHVTAEFDLHGRPVPVVSLRGALAGILAAGDDR